MSEKTNIVKLVHDALKKFTRPEFGAEILVYLPSIRHKDDWWYVPVYPSKELKRVYDYYDILASAEEELQENNQKIALIPVRPKG